MYNQWSMSMKPNPMKQNDADRIVRQVGKNPGVKYAVRGSGYTLANEIIENPENFHLFITDFGADWNEWYMTKPPMNTTT